MGGRGGEERGEVGQEKVARGVVRKGGRPRTRAASHSSPPLFRPWALKDPSSSKEVL